MVPCMPPPQELRSQFVKVTSSGLQVALDAEPVKAPAVMIRSGPAADGEPDCFRHTVSTSGPLPDPNDARRIP